MILLPRNIAENILLNKHKIKTIPLLNTTNERIIEDVIGNEKRLLKSYPMAYDFLVNMINKVHFENLSNVIFDEDRNYYSMLISKNTFDNYFCNCGNFKIRQSLKRQFLKDFRTGFIYLKENGYIELRRPFFISAERLYETGNKEYEIYFSKLIFKNLVEKRHKGDGYIKIPALLYPYSTNAKNNILGSHNPHYKANVFGLLKNTNAVKTKKVNRQEFIENVLPEYATFKNGKYRLKLASYLIHSDLLQGLKDIRKNLKDDLLINNFYLGDERENITTLHFRKE